VILHHQHCHLVANGIAMRAKRLPWSDDEAHARMCSAGSCGGGGDDDGDGGGGGGGDDDGDDGGSGDDCGDD
jgi:hypothetical protein